MKKKDNVLFITRVHPPVTGGMENQSYQLITHFKELHENTFVIKNTKGKKALAYFIPFAFFRALYLIRKHKINYVHLSDGVLAPLGAALKKFTNAKILITIHGLDITWPNPVFQAVVPKAIRKLDTIICVSKNTKNECIKKGILEQNTVVIPNGVDVTEFVLQERTETLRKKLAKQLNIQLTGKTLLLSTGRLVKRKGTAWFIAHVLPKLGKNYLYFVSGDGKERKNIEQAIKESQLSNVYLLGRTSKQTLRLLYNATDLFIMPNVSVLGDAEGFGLVALEASSCGLPVIASNIEGIPDAVHDKKTGFLVEEKNAKQFLQAIKKAEDRFTKSNVKKATQAYSWDKTAKKILEIMQ